MKNGEGKKLLDERLYRFCLAAGAKKNSELAECLGVKKTSFQTALSRGNGDIPLQWYFIFHEKYDVSMDWLYSGKGKMRFEDDNMPKGQSIQHMVQSVMNTLTELGASNEEKIAAIQYALKAAANESK